MRQFGERGLNQNQAGAGCVVAQPNARRRLRPAGCGGQRLGGLKELDRAGNVLNLANGDGAGAVEHHGVLGGVEDGRFDAMGCRTRIENSVDAAIEVLEDMGGGRGAGAGESIGAGRGDGHTGLADQLEGNRMRWHANAHQGATGGDGVGDGGGARQQQGKRAGPEGLHETARGLGNLRDQAVEHGVVCDRAGEVDDDGVPRRALFGGEDAGHGGGVEGVGAQPVHGLSGESNEAPGAEDLRGARNGLAGLVGIEMGGVHSQAKGFHASIVAVYGRRRHLPYTHRLRCRLRRRSNSGWTILPH